MILLKLFQYIAMLVEILNAPQKPHESSGKFSVSSIGNCWRKKYLEIKKLYKEEYDERTKRTFRVGDEFHKIILRELIEKTGSSDWKVLCGELNIPEDHPDAKYISGRTDLMLGNSKTGERVIVDCKSCSDYVLAKAQEGEVSDNYRWQVQLYLHFFNLQRGFLLFFSKHKGEYCEVEIIRDDALISKLLEDIKHFWEEHVLKNIEPEPCDGYNGGKFECSVCKQNKNIITTAK